MDILTEAPNLLRRYQQGDKFRTYVRQRQQLVTPAVVAFALFSLAVTVGTVLFVGNKHALLFLLGLIGGPFILIGSFVLQMYLFFSWLELRALGSSANLLPMVPWVAVALFLAAPWLALAVTWTSVALLVLVLAGAAPVAYWRLDKAQG